MKKLVAVVTVAVMAGAIGVSAGVGGKYIKSSYISSGTIAVSCKSGDTPRVIEQIGEALIVSCGVK